jgi:hypothetical protein
MLGRSAAGALALVLAGYCVAQTPASGSCTGLLPQACLGLAVEAMGGRERLESIHTVRLDSISHTALMEQSYRQDPFITSYERDRTTIDLTGGRLRTEAHGVWPESDLNEAESDNVLIASAAGGVYHGAKADAPCSRGPRRTCTTPPTRGCAAPSTR